MTNHYSTLGVDATATEADLKRQYRRRAKATHPDTNGHGSTIEFQAVQRAYAVLSDPSSRADYDKFGEAGCKVQSLREQAEAALSLVVAQAVPHFDVDKENVLELVRKSICVSMDGYLLRALECEKMAARFRSAAKRLKRRDKQPSPLAAALEATALEHDNAAKAARFEQVKGSEMLAVLAEHKYKVDYRTEAPGGGFATWNNATGSWQPH